MYMHKFTGRMDYSNPLHDAGQRSAAGNSSVFLYPRDGQEDT